MHNPYQPPESPATRLDQLAGKRTLSVWLLLLALGATIILLATGIASYLQLLMIVIRVGDYLPLLASMSVRVAVFALAVAALLGTLRRRQSGRWLGILMICIMTAAVSYVPPTAQYANQADGSGGTFSNTILLTLLMGWWIYGFGFSRKARRYFAP